MHVNVYNKVWSKRSYTSSVCMILTMDCRFTASRSSWKVASERANNAQRNAEKGDKKHPL